MNTVVQGSSPALAKLEDLPTPSGFAAWGSFCGAHSMTRCAVIAANIAKLPELLRGKADSP